MKPPFTNVDQIEFGRVFTPNMYTRRYKGESGWLQGKIEENKPLSLHPAASVFHYSQEIFEGLKVFRTVDGRLVSFRPKENAKRMNRSARRLFMPEMVVEEFLNALKELVLMDQQWVPALPETSLYVRPTMISSESFLGVKPANEYLFYIILSPVGPYFKEGFNPINIYVEEEMVRAVIGGVGDVKAGGNYAASLLAGQKAKEKGFSQVLWLDAKEHKYVEEVGAMNIFFVYDNKLATPNLNGSILPGITRKSILEVAEDLGYETEEKPIHIDEVFGDIKTGKITEVFICGTAAVISPVGLLHYKGKECIINNKETGLVTKHLYNQIVGIQYGQKEDKYGWLYEIGRA